MGPQFFGVPETVLATKPLSFSFGSPIVPLGLHLFLPLVQVGPLVQQLRWWGRRGNFPFSRYFLMFLRVLPDNDLLPPIHATEAREEDGSKEMGPLETNLEAWSPHLFLIRPVYLRMSVGGSHRRFDVTRDLFVTSRGEQLEHLASFKLRRNVASVTARHESTPRSD